jgi:hypothetical protein
VTDRIAVARVVDARCDWMGARSLSSVVLTADAYLSVAVELGLKAAAAAARLFLNAGKSPPGGGSVRRRSAPVLAEITTCPSGTLGTCR